MFHVKQRHGIPDSQNMLRRSKAGFTWNARAEYAIIAIGPAEPVL
jgi:hypothetical protein